MAQEGLIQRLLALVSSDAVLVALIAPVSFGIAAAYEEGFAEARGLPTGLVSVGAPQVFVAFFALVLYALGGLMVGRVLMLAAADPAPSKQANVEKSERRVAVGLPYMRWFLIALPLLISNGADGLVIVGVVFVVAALVELGMTWYWAHEQVIGSANKGRRTAVLKRVLGQKDGGIKASILQTRSWWRWRTRRFASYDLLLSRSVMLIIATLGVLSLSDSAGRNRSASQRDFFVRTSDGAILLGIYGSDYVFGEFHPVDRSVGTRREVVHVGDEGLKVDLVHLDGPLKYGTL
jgi:hypothetical protein